jgi:selenocysteine lyase/cysteine desulfurase
MNELVSRLKRQGAAPFDGRDPVPYTRREFLESMSAAAALSGIARTAVAQVDDDPLGVRDDFPVVREMTYLDSAYITPSPLQAIRAAQSFAEAKARNPVSLGDMLEEANEVRRKFAQLVGASEPEVGLLFATSEGENIVSRALDLGSGDNVVIDDLHYETTFVLYRHLVETRGIDLRIVKSREGVAPPEEFAKLVDDRTRLVSVAWVSHQNGYQHDLRALAQLAHSHGAYLYADAIQGVGMLSLDVKAVGIDFLTSGTYKWLLGGYGVAPFYVRQELLDTVELDRMGSLHIARDLGDHRYELYTDARKYGYATLAFGAVFQLRAALDYLLEVGVQNVERHTVALAQRLREGLVGQGYPVWTPAGNRSAIITFEHGLEVERVRAALEAANIKVSLKAQGVQIRAGVALFNNARDIERLLEVTGAWV